MAEPKLTLTRQQRRARERAAKKAARGAMAVGALLAAGSASAATITVNSLADTAVAGDTQCTLREALTNAETNSDTTGGDCTAGVAGLDTIAFKAGLTGTILLTGSELPQIIEDTTVNGPGAAVITISGNNASRIFHVESAANVPINANINNLRLTAGNDASYGGAVFATGENLTLDHVVITGNTSSDIGGGVAFLGYNSATLAITNSTISGNTALANGAGLAIAYAHGAVTITNTTISGNASTFGGGGIWTYYLYAPMTITGATITGNTAGNGGGILAQQLYADLTITNSTLSGNLAGITSNGHGGALDVSYTYASVYLLHDTFGGPNASDANKAGVEGGAINVLMGDGAFVQIQNTQVLNNIAGMQTGYFGDGGGVRLEASSEIAAVATAAISDSVISGNIADPQDGTAVVNNVSDVGYGGGLYLKGYLSTTISRTTISGNTAAFGGGAYLYTYADATFENSTIANNTATTPTDQTGTGGGVHLSTQYAATFKETTISGNTAEGGAGGVYAYLGDIILNNSIVANSSGAPDVVRNAGPVTANYTLIENLGSTVLTGTGNITGSDPALGALADNGSTILAGNPNATQVHPQTELPATNSPVVNAGDPAFTPPPATDERGAPRVQGGRIDMGAAEIPAPTISIGNVSQAEGNSGTTTFNFQVTLSAPMAQNVTVNYATANGTATAPSDYATAGGVVTFTSGQTSQTIPISVVGDTNVEPNETFTVNLSAPSANATVSTGTGTGTIQNDDVLASVDLAINKSLAGGPFVISQNLTYSIVVTNAGPGAATTVTVTDVIPPGASYVSATPSQGSCVGTSTVICNLGTIANGGNASIALTVTATAAGSLSNTATVSAGAQPDTNLTNNSSTSTVPVAAASAPALSRWLEMMLIAVFSVLGLLKIQKN